jgi:starvation-inducible DNA-binding protein
MTTKSSSSLTTPAGQLDDGRRAEIISDINTSLGYMVDLHVSAKQAHWNVHGPNFAGLHELFDTIADEARHYADTIAERCLALRGTAHGTINDVSGMKQLSAFPTDMQDWEGLTKAMHERLMEASERLRESAGSMDDELGTQDIYVEVIRGLDKWAWMLEAHLSNGGRSR